MGPNRPFLDLTQQAHGIGVLALNSGDGIAMSSAAAQLDILAALEALASEVRMLRHGGTPKLLTIEAAASALSVSERTVRRYIADGWLQIVLLPAGDGHRDIRRIDRTDLDAFVARRRSGVGVTAATDESDRVYSVPCQSSPRNVSA